MAETKRKNTRRMNDLRRQFFEEGRRLDADPATRDQSVCWICLGRIDYDAEPGSTPDSHNLDHYHAVSESPEMQEDPENFRHSHRRCNGARGALAPEGDLGELVADWW